MSQEKEYFNYYGQQLPKSIKSIFYVYKTEFEVKFEISSPKNSVKNNKLISDLVKEFGFDTSLELIIWSISNWKRISDYLKVITYPSLSFLYGFRYSLLALKNSNKIKDISSIKSNHNDIFD